MLNPRLSVVVLIGLTGLAGGLSYGAKKTDEPVAAHKPVTIESSPGVVKDIKKPASGASSPAPYSHAVPVQPIQEKPEPQPAKLPETKVEPPGPEVVKVPQPDKSPASRAPAPGQGAAGIANVPKDPLAGNEAAIRDANQARLFEEAREAAEAVRDLSNVSRLGEGAELDLGLGGSQGAGIGGREVDLSDLPGHEVAGYETPEGTEYLPALPSNKDKAPPSIVGAPSGDLRSAMQGADGDFESTVRGVRNFLFGDDSPPERLPRDGDHTTTERTSDGGIIVRTRNGHTGYSETAAVRRTTWDRTNPNGWVGVYTQHNPDGSGQRTIVVRNEDGDVTDKAFYKWNPGEDVPPLNQTQDRDANTGGGGKSYYDHSKGSEPPVVTYVNPGPDGATPMAKAPRLVLPEDQLVINPSPENTGQSRELSEEQRRVMAGQLREEVKGPGGHPGDTAVDDNLNTDTTTNQTQ